MKIPYFNQAFLNQVFLALTIVFFNGGIAMADESPVWQEYTEQANKAYGDGKYTKAGRLWAKVIKVTEHLEPEPSVELVRASSLKGIADANRQQGVYDLANEFYVKCIDAFTKLGTENKDATSSLAEIGSFYRIIPMESLGEDANKLLKKAGATGVASFKTESGHHLELTLQDKFNELIDDATVKQVNFNKRICFDLEQTPDGKLNVSKIKGIRLKASVWVSPLSTSLYLNEKGETVADLTVDALGFRKTVNVNPPRQIYDYVAHMVKQVTEQPTVASFDKPDCKQAVVEPCSMPATVSETAPSTVDAPEKEVQNTTKSQGDVSVSE